MCLEGRLNLIEKMADDQWSTLAWKDTKTACSLAGYVLGAGGIRGVRNSLFCQGAHTLVGEHTSKQALRKLVGLNRVKRARKYLQEIGWNGHNSQPGEGKRTEEMKREIGRNLLIGPPS